MYLIFYFFCFLDTRIVSFDPRSPFAYISFTGSVVHGRCPGDFGRTRDVRKSMSGTVSAGQLGHGPILDIFWPELTSDVASINADKKSWT
jgi:hypothetical protein